MLVDLTHVSGASLHNARAITHQLTDVSIRVPGVRRYAVKAMCDVLLAGRLLTASGANNCMSEVLHAAAFIVGEFSEYVEEHVEVIRCMMRTEVSGLSGETQNVFVQSVMKVLAAGLYQPYNQMGEDREASMEVKVKDLLGRRHVDEEEEEKEDDGDEVKEQLEQPTAAQPSQAEDADPEQEEEELDENGVKKRKVKAKRRTYHAYLVFVGEMLECLYTHLPLFCRSSHVEVQERAVSYHELVGWVVHHAQMQPFISVNVESKTDKVAGDTNNATNGEKPDKAQSDTASSPALNLLDDHSASSPRPANNAPLPPAPLLSSIAVQLCMLFSERLNPVNPKAQKKVPVPKGLDLNQPIHDGWEVDSEASESEDESEESDGNERSSSNRSGRHDKDSRKRDKGREKDKKRSRKDRKGAGLLDDEYSAPQTAEEKARDQQEAKRRLEARKQAQMNDPFYLVDRKTASTAAAQQEDSGLRQRGREELPESTAAKRDSEKERKKSRKQRGGDEDDIFAGVGDSKPKKVYKVHKVEDMPSDALSSEEEQATHGDGARDKDKQARKKTRDRERHGDKARARGRKEREEEKDRQSEDREDKEKKKKKKDRREDRAAAVDDFDPMNDSSSRAASDKSDDDNKKAKKDKDRGSKRDGVKDRDRDRVRDKKEKKKSSKA